MDGYSQGDCACGAPSSVRARPGDNRERCVHAFMRVGEASSAALGMSVSGAGVRNAADIERALTELAQEPNGGLIGNAKPTDCDQTHIDHRLGCATASADDLFVPFLCRQRRLGVLRNRSD